MRTCFTCFAWFINLVRVAADNGRHGDERIFLNEGEEFRNELKRTNHPPCTTPLDLGLQPSLNARKIVPVTLSITGVGCPRHRPDKIRARHK